MPNDAATGLPCARWVEAISALADGEDPGIDPRLVEAHLRRCSNCRAVRARLQPGGSAREPRDVPGLANRVTRAVARADRRSSPLMARGLLAVIAVQLVVLAAPDLWSDADTSSSVHLGRHLGSFSVAYAVGLVVVILRPARARTMLPVAAVLSGALAITAVADVANGVVPLVGEAVHIPELLSVPLLWWLANPDRPLCRPAGPSKASRAENSPDAEGR